MSNSSYLRLSLINILRTWALALVIAPALLVLFTSLLQNNFDTGAPIHLSLTHYSSWAQPAYINILTRSITQAFITTLICLVIGYPTAITIARLKPRHRTIALFMIILPFWTSALIRTYAIVALLKAKGLINTILLTTGVIDQPLALLYSNTAVIIGCVYDLLPFMILPLYTSISKLDPDLILAAKDLGASNSRLYLKIILPLTAPGIMAGSLLVFLPSITLFYIPILLGGAKSMLVGNLIADQFLAIHQWPAGAASSVLLTATVLFAIALFRRMSKQKLSEDLFR